MLASAKVSQASSTPAVEINSRFARSRACFVGALVLLLFWIVLTRGLAAYLAEVNPEAALWLRPTQPLALTRLADIKLNPLVEAEHSTQPSGTDSPTDDVSLISTPHGSGKIAPEVLNEIEAQAQQAIRISPLNARALRVLGQVAAQRSDIKRADVFMSAATKYSVNETFAAYWNTISSFEKAQYDATLKYTDILLRTRRQVHPYAVRVLASLAERPIANEKLKILLAMNPPWRTEFFRLLPNIVSDARTPLDLLLSLKDTQNPPTPAELQSYLAVLEVRGFHELAYYAWLQFLSPEQLTLINRLYDGGFEGPSSGSPFDWRFEGGAGVNIQISEKPDFQGDKALLIEFGLGRVEFGGVSQTVLLPPGNYNLEGKYSSDLASQRGVQWRIQCGSRVLGKSQAVTGKTKIWSGFRVPFEVPENCPVQQIKLLLDARSTSETFISGSVWYDEIRISERSPQESEKSPEDAAPNIEPAN